MPWDPDEMEFGLPLIHHEQVDHGPTQVKAPTDLVVGQEYLHHLPYGPGSRLRILEQPTSMDDGEGTVKVEFTRDGRRKDLHLDSLGLAPFNGTWNPTNWLQRVE